MKSVYLGLSILFLSVFWGEAVASTSPATLSTVVTPASNGAVFRILSKRLSAEEWASLNSSSSKLLRWAWKSLAAGNFNGAAAYANRVIDLYSSQADEMQAGLTDLPSGHPDEISRYWALNDVSTALFILGESYRGSGREQEALEIYRKIIDRYSYGQYRDSRGWFWSVAAASRDRLDMAAMTRESDRADHQPNVLLQKARLDAAQGRSEPNTALPSVGIPLRPWM